jgi:predicted Fe-Mo cluster-binding NifX family protein
MSDKKTIAIPVNDMGGLEATVSPHFGRCAAFALVQVADGTIVDAKTIPNPMASGHAVGDLPTMMRQLGANVVLAGGMGPRAIEFLARFGIEASRGATGLVKDAVLAYLDGHAAEAAPCEEGVAHMQQGGEHMN